MTHHLFYWTSIIILGAVIGLAMFGRSWFDTMNRQRRAKKGGCQ